MDLGFTCSDRCARKWNKEEPVDGRWKYFCPHCSTRLDIGLFVPPTKLRFNCRKCGQFVSPNLMQFSRLWAACCLPWGLIASIVVFGVLYSIQPSLIARKNAPAQATLSDLILAVIVSSFISGIAVGVVSSAVGTTLGWSQFLREVFRFGWNSSRVHGVFHAGLGIVVMILGLIVAVALGIGIATGMGWKVW
jgi:hypothetical protein